METDEGLYDLENLDQVSPLPEGQRVCYTLALRNNASPVATGLAQDVSSLHPPSFSESQFDVILRRQRPRHRHAGGLKLTSSPSRFLSLSNEFEFAGWGSVSYIELSNDDLQRGETRIQEDNDEPILGSWMASAVAANDLFGGVFYAFPPLVAIAGI